MGTGILVEVEIFGRERGRGFDGSRLQERMMVDWNWSCCEFGFSRMLYAGKSWPGASPHVWRSHPVRRHANKTWPGNENPAVQDS